MLFEGRKPKNHAHLVFYDFKDKNMIASLGHIFDKHMTIWNSKAEEVRSVCLSVYLDSPVLLIMSDQQFRTEPPDYSQVEFSYNSEGLLKDEITEKWFTVYH